MTMQMSWLDWVKLIGGMLLRTATDPPDEYKGVRYTAKGNDYKIYKIPELFDKLPWQFCFTLSIPGMEEVLMLIRGTFFEPGMEQSLDKLFGHEEEHVDEWSELGPENFAKKWISSGGRMDVEARAHANDVDWKMKHETPTLPFPEIEPIDYWMLYYAAKIDQVYRIRGKGMPEAYDCLQKWVILNTEWAPKPYSQVKQWKDYFKHLER